MRSPKKKRQLQKSPLILLKKFQQSVNPESVIYIREALLNISKMKRKLYFSKIINVDIVTSV